MQIVRNNIEDSEKALIQDVAGSPACLVVKLPQDGAVVRLYCRLSAHGV